MDFRKAAVNCTKGPRLACVSTTDLVVHLFAGVSVLHFFFFQISFFFISEEKGEDTLHTLSQDKDIQRLLRIPIWLKASLLLNKAFRYVSYLDEAE